MANYGEAPGSNDPGMPGIYPGVRRLFLAGMNEEHDRHADKEGNQVHYEYHLLAAGGNYFIVRHNVDGDGRKDNERYLNSEPLANK